MRPGIVIHLGNRDDTVLYDSDVPTEQRGGEGDDVLSGNAWPDRMAGLGGTGTCAQGLYHLCVQ